MSSTAESLDLPATLNRSGRPAKSLTDDEAMIACEVIASGGTFRRAAKQIGINRQVLWDAMQASPERRAAYARAREARGQADADKLTTLNRQMLAGKVEPDVGRVVSGNLQWLAAAHDGKRWGRQPEAPAVAADPFSPDALVAKLQQLAAANPGIAAKFGIRIEIGAQVEAGQILPAPESGKS